MVIKKQPFLFLKIIKSAIIFSKNGVLKLFIGLNLFVMKKIEAIIRLSRFDKIRDALALIGINFFTLQDVKGFGLQKGEKMVYRGSVYDADYIARLQIDILTTDDMVDAVVDAIISSGKTGEVGDGKIIVYDVQEVVRIRTGEKGSEAV